MYIYHVVVLTLYNLQLTDCGHNNNLS